MYNILRILISLLLLIVLVAGGNFRHIKRDRHALAKKFQSCGGKLQSPVAISSSKSTSLPLPALEIIGYHDFLPGPLYLKNNGHSVLMNINKQSERKLPYVFGGVFKVKQEYEIDHLHFHWGARNNRGSEHVLNGLRYPMEMHIVHRNKAYRNISTALNYKDGLMVLAVFFQLQEESNKLLHPIIKELIGVKRLNKEIRLNASVVLASLLPNDVDVFYTYKGSLTTPPYSEVVTWIIFPMPVPISFAQLEKFRSLSDGEDMLADNYRQLQDIGLRRVYVRRLDPFLFAKYNETVFDVTNLNWFWY